MSGGTIIRDIFIRHLLFLHYAFARITTAFVTLFIYDILHTRVGQRFVRAHVFSRPFVEGNAVRFSLRFVFQTSAIVGRFQNDLAGEVLLIRFSRRGTRLEYAALFLTAAH